MASFKKHGRKLLVASVGVAAVSYVAAGGCGSEVVANLIAEPAKDSGVATDAPKDNGPPINWDVVANLVAPPRD